MTNTFQAKGPLTSDEAAENARDSRVRQFGVDGTGVAVEEYDRAIAFGAGFPPPARPRTTRIVVGLDGSDASLDALRRAVRIAAGLHALVQPVVAWHTPASFGMVGFSDWSPQADADQILTEAVEKVFHGVAPEWLCQTVREGLPADVLIEESKGAEMLVVGSRGHGGVAGLLLGSVSPACAERARCPVLIMHHDDTK